MAEVEWIKVSTSMFETSRKIKQIELMNNGDGILVIWLKLLLLAGNINDGGAIYITEDKPYDLASLSGELRRPPKLVKQALDVFEDYGMIENTEQGFIYLTSWEKYQSVEKLDIIREQTRKRVEKCRRKKKEETALNAVTGNAQCNANVTLGNDAEEEEELDLEFQSINLSGVCAGAREDDDEVVENLKKSDLMRRYLGGTLGGGVVLLSKVQFDTLCDELSHEELERYLAVVRDCEKQGKHYKKSHYQAIRDMAHKDRRI